MDEVVSVALLKRHEIDEARWNEVISQSANSLPYGFTWYLDAVAARWNALVWGDYEAVMPLPFFTRLGIRYLYQPHYCQQLGIFFRHEWSDSTAIALLRRAINRYPFVQYQLHAGCGSLTKMFRLQVRKNLILNVSAGIDTIRKRYSENHKRNLTKAARHGLVYLTTKDLHKFVEFYELNVDREKENLQEKHIRHFKKLCDALQVFSQYTVAVAGTAEGEWLAAVLLLYHASRVIALVNCSGAEGKRKGASHFLFDNIIRSESGHTKWLDFEGSSIPSVARFYEGFGAEPEIYYQIKRSPMQYILPGF
ncbi:MAG: hypothetical protein NZM35_07975 [Chitinophagales bacterium]|nr:hypothetical protein [Chitinophagales bacterium]